MIFGFFILFFLNCREEANVGLHSRGVLQSGEDFIPQKISQTSNSGSEQSKMMNIYLKALDVVSFFETSGQGFSGVTGNFDGQGVSWGILQWNFGQNTLQPLLTQIIQKNPEKTKSIWGPLFPTLQTLSQATVAKALSICQSEVLSGIELRTEWKNGFEKLGKEKFAMDAQMSFTKKYLHTTFKEMYHLKFRSVRSFLTLFQNNVQNGFTYEHDTSDEVGVNYRNWLKSNEQVPEIEKLRQLMKYLVEVVPSTSRENVRIRVKISIEGKGFVNGKDIDVEKDYHLKLDDDLPTAFLSLTHPNLVD
jgi:hypothetical protein